MEKILNQILGELQDLNRKYENLNNRYENLNNKYENLNNKYENLGGKISGLNEKYESLDKKVDSHGDLLHQLIQIVGATNAHVEGLVEDMEQIKSIQAEQQRILEHLSLRSITHDLEINDLRRIK